ncbi:MAG: glycosyltransferase family 4 protein [Candidatus Paceibacterota bacterium]
MKILIATGIYPPDIGGPATILGALALSLEDNGFEVKILTYSEKCGREGNVTRIKKGGLLSYLKYFFTMLSLSFWADIIYVTDTYSVGYFAYLIKKLTGKKYILRFAGDAAWESAVNKKWTSDYILDFYKKIYGGKIERIKKRTEKIIIGADKVVAVCIFLGNLAEKIGADKKNIKVIYNSVDFMKDGTIPTIPEIGLRNRFGKDAKLIIYSGRLVPWKGVKVIIEIMPRLMEKIKNTHFLVLGDGQEKENIKSQISKLKIDDNVHLLGKIEHDKIAGYLKEADLFVLNTNYEGMSHAILEAMSAGAPVVSTNVGGNPELIESGKEGILVNYNDKEELLAAMTKILSDNEFSKAISANAKKKLEKFRWADNIEETTRVMKEIL